MLDDHKQFTVYMKALSDETRLRIYSMLAGEELCACNLLEAFRITQPTLSYHMKILCGSGLVDVRKDGVWMRYSVNREKAALLGAFFQEVEAASPGEGQRCKQC
ncbi:ArsR/SmtB family transcription factor [Anaerotalea alkaliphila]|uniref:Helix-turn-helix transcriptional regulator n=1 Tax=Anaerotalea alkaliphila TaxID=2662126 RepID=A0A7X5HVI1_9FIRM|nr:metalloregulator ArsR/SmtB family transcription factor [Anaerotalea alkaliphila]NDL67416.1 helix-turn-helix transcriptional regulator [Anaerotalea alkaliphila]